MYRCLGFLAFLALVPGAKIAWVSSPAWAEGENPCSHFSQRQSLLRFLPAESAFSPTAPGPEHASWILCSGHAYATDDPVARFY